MKTIDRVKFFEVLTLIRRGILEIVSLKVISLRKGLRERPINLVSSVHQR